MEIPSHLTHICYLLPTHLYRTINSKYMRDFNNSANKDLYILIQKGIKAH
jgi:hypothetical protein